MADKPTTTFSFGKPNSSNATSSSNTTSTPAPSLFGTTTNTSSLFGTTTSSSGTSTPPIFSSATSTSNALDPLDATSSADDMNNPNSVLFGAGRKINAPISFTMAPSTSGSSTPQGPASGRGTGLFGSVATPPSTTPAGEPKTGSIFGGNQPAAGAGGSLFGGGGNQGDKSSTFAFGQTGGTTPRGAVHSGSIFGQNGSSNIQNNNQNNTQNTSVFGGGQRGGVFGGGAPSSGASAFGSTGQTSSAAPTGQSSGSLFGTQQNTRTATPTGSTFGSAATPATSGAGNNSNTGGLFGSRNATTTSGQTGMLGSTTTSSSGGSLFPSSNNATSGTEMSSIFQPQNGRIEMPSNSGGLFQNLSNNQNSSGPAGGNTPATTAPQGTSSLFSNPSSQAPSGGSTPGGGLFGNTSSQAPPGGSTPGGGLFSNTSSQAPPGGSTPGSSLFNNTSSQAPPGGSTPGGGLFSNTSSQAPPNTSTPASGDNQQNPLFAALNKRNADAAAAANNASSQAPASTGGTPSLFSGLNGGNNTSQPGSTAAPSGGLFSSTTSGANTTASATSGTTATAGAGGSTTTTAPTTGTAPGTGSRLAHKSLDEVLTLWSSSLATHQKTFQSLAKRVSTWDRQLVENSTKISALYGRCFQAERDCNEVERQLSNVEQQQTDIENILDRYEEEIDKMMGASGVGEDGISGVDAERERTYKTAENCASRLSEFQHSLGDMVEEINVSSNKLANNNQASEEGDPLRQIVGILNRHLGQLQTIGTGAQDLQEKVAAAQKEARNLGASQGLNGGDWVEGFGRSYLGRR